MAKFTVVVDDTKSNTLLPSITDKIVSDRIVYTDGYKSYNALDGRDFYHKSINHSKLFAKGKNHINGIENFWTSPKEC